MFKVKKLAVAAAMMLVAGSAFASNFRAADQVYVPAAGHIAAQRHVHLGCVLSNLSTDSVTVTVIYVPLGRDSDALRRTSRPSSSPPGERKEFIDFFVTALGLTSGIGQLIFNACKQGTRLRPDHAGPVRRQPLLPSASASRAASTRSRRARLSRRTRRPPASFPRLSRGTASSRLTQRAVGLRQGLHHRHSQHWYGQQAGTYRGNIGLVNASQFSTTTTRVKLFNGATGAQIGSTFTSDLGPLGNVQVNRRHRVPQPSPARPRRTRTSRSSRQQHADQRLAAELRAERLPGVLRLRLGPRQRLGRRHDARAAVHKALTDAAIACIYNADLACKSTTGFRRAVKH